jgi:hypothetical protein
MSKYHSVKTEIDGYVFASKAEAHRYSELKLLEMEGSISCLELQPKFPIIVNGKKIATYIADFRYLHCGTKQIIEDVKGVRTPVYRLKKKLVEAIFGITITEVSR